MPYNPGNSAHWFLIVVLPKDKKVMALDSLAASFTKPTVKKAIDKMWSLLKELDGTLDVHQWPFLYNLEQDIPQQQNGFDCGVYVLLYARCLVLQSTIVSSSSIQFLRKHIIVEIHEQELHGFAEQDIKIGQYYAVEYQKS